MADRGKTGISQRQLQVANLCQRVVDACLLACLVLVPLWFGGRHDLGRLIYTAVVATATLAWVIRCVVLNERRSRYGPAHMLWMLAVGIVTLQLIPLSPELLDQVSPALAKLLPTWTAASEFPLKLGQWQTISVNPSATRSGLAVLIGHALLFCLTVERLRSLEDMNRLLRAIAIASAGMAAFGLLQWLTSNGKLLWFYAHPQRNIGAAVQGSFANKNHFAHFVVLGLGPLTMAMLAARSLLGHRKELPADRWRRQMTKLFWSAALLISVVAVVFSLSRGGLMAMCVALATGGSILLRFGQLRFAHASTLGGITLALLLAVSMGDSHRIFARFDDIAGGSIEQLDSTGGRREIWTANLKALQANPWMGYGVGSHRLVYPAFFEGGFTTEFTHAESGYLHTTTETGLAGGCLLLAGLSLVGWWMVRGLVTETDPQRVMIWAAVATGLVASVAHSIVDFVWYIPACMSVTVMLAACALRLYETTPGSSRETSPTKHRASPQIAWVPLVTASLMAIWATSSLYRPGTASLAWDRYLRASRIERQLLADQLTRPSESAESTNASVALLKQQMIDSLQVVLAKDPNNARAHQRLAGRLLQQFELARRDSPNAIGLVQAREAALASNYVSRRETVEWLSRAFEADADKLTRAYHHARFGLASSPMEEDGYSYLADLCYLSPPNQRDITAFVDQALLLRPNDGGILFQAGKQAMVQGDGGKALEYWKQAHAFPGNHRLLIMHQLAGRIPAQNYLEEFQPDWQILTPIYHRYRETNNGTDLSALGDYAATLAELPIKDKRDARRSAAAWILVSSVQLELGNQDESFQAAERATDALPNDYTARTNLAALYVKAKEYRRAEPHIRWCLSRRPHDKTLQHWLAQARKEHLAEARMFNSTETKKR